MGFPSLSGYSISGGWETRVTLAMIVEASGTIGEGEQRGLSHTLTDGARRILPRSRPGPSGFERFHLCRRGGARRHGQLVGHDTNRVVLSLLISQKRGRIVSRDFGRGCVDRGSLEPDRVH